MRGSAVNWNPRCQPLCHNDIIATRLSAVSRSRAEAGLPVRAAQPLRATLSTSIVLQPCWQPNLHNALTFPVSARARSVGCGPEAAEPHIRLPQPRRYQNSSYLRSSGSEERNQSLWRHLAARTLSGPPRRDPARVSVPRGWLGLRQVAGCVRPSSASHPPALRHGSSSARARSAACVRAQRSRSVAPVRVPCPPERGTSSSVRCQADVSPTAAQFDHDGAQAPVASFRDALLPIDLPAAPRGRHQPSIGCHLAPIAEVSIQTFEIQHGSDLRTDGLEPCEKRDR